MAKNDKKHTARSSTAKSRKATRPSEDEIARLAYKKFEERGWIHGFATDDWLSAEAELGGQRVPSKG